MKKFRWILLSLYFVLFISFGLIFYFKYLDRFLKSGAEPQKIETLQNADYIYYGTDNNLFRLKPELQIDPANLGRIERLQSTGEVGTVEINKTGDLLVYDAKNSQGQREIWQVETKTNQSSKIAAQDLEGLNNFREFFWPQLSPNNRQVAFVASAAYDQVMIYDLSSRKTFPLMSNFAVQLAAFSWSPDSQKIIFCTNNLDTNACQEINLNNSSDRQILVAEVSQIAQTEEGYIYLAKDGESVNLFQLGLKSENIFRITDLIAPKKVSQFQLDNNKKQIVYEVQEGNKSDIYLVKTDGTNKIQLTLDGLSREPVIKPSGEDVAFRRASDGIYVIRIDKSSEKKILNFTESGETKIKLLLWR